ncbi:MAG: archaemetzincin family Zn-dependent metalloprotease [Armatimonadota bacterium]|nr:MAG: archaemetzincin family Zn-dependent metalloprotease [Armatimonadota bacterium]
MRLELVAVGEVDGNLLRQVAVGAESVLHMPVTVARDALPLPAFAYHHRRRQFLATAFIEEAVKRRPPDTTHTLAVTGADLHAPRLNFVFGQADFSDRTAVISLARLREEFWGRRPDDELLLQRAVKEAVHEIGHTLGLGHCSDALCVMRFSNQLADTDRKSRDFCARCGRELDLSAARR